MRARTITEHTDAVLALARPRAESFSLFDATSLTLAADTPARLPVPPFANSAMDGFALHAADLAAAGLAAAGLATGDAAGGGGAGGARFPVAGDVPAGGEAIACPPGHAVRVMTGAPVPPGEDIVVVPVEQTDIAPGPVPLPAAVTVRRFDPARSHVRAAGSDAAAGHVVAAAGTVVDAATLAALTAAGVRKVEAYLPPRVAVISTGDELVAWPGDVSGSQIPNSNLPMLAEIARAAGAGPVAEFQASDRVGGPGGGGAGGAGGFAAAFKAAAADADLVVTSGGVSAGAFDVVRAATQPSGTMWFGHVAQRPGGPQGVGTFAGTPLLCLPGNPVAAFVSAHLYLVPLIRAFAGRTAGLRLENRPRVRAEVAESFTRPHPEKTLIVPVQLLFDAASVHATQCFPGAGSHRVASLSGADGLAVLPPAGAGRAGSSPGVPRTVDVLPTRAL